MATKQLSITHSNNTRLWYSAQFVPESTVVLILYVSHQLGLKVLREGLFCFCVTRRLIYNFPESGYTIFMVDCVLSSISKVLA